ncbi:MAG: glycosyltransferase [Patescibacteria group bacterium]|nr:glycosyltransferase [Patescibacteria group bacterium]
MKDLRIVIVSWNVQDHLGRCLASLPQACAGLDWECIVVDNNSSDSSLEVIKRFSSQNERTDVIANKKNYGFAYACNQGAARLDAKYVLFLNPDTECPAESLSQLVAAANRRPEAGVMGPGLVYPDGRYQPSVQRFPALRDQSLILLKLHHIFPAARSLKRYFAQDIDRNKSQSVDQVMGACFLVRRECWEKIHGFDERYFIWFEEVDACRQAKKDGWLVWYEPSVTIVHHEGQAFSKVWSWRRQSYFNDSLRKYMRKWHGFWAWLAVTCLSPISLGMAAVLTPLMLPPSTRKSIMRAKGKEELAGTTKVSLNWMGWLGLIVSIELVSALAQGHDFAQVILIALCGLILAVIAYYRPYIALSIVAAELMIGGFGYLLNAPAEILVRGISLRIVLMAGFFVGWAINALQARVWKYWRLKELSIVQVWVFVGGMIVGGLLRAWQLHQPYFFQDFNAWLFLLYFVPVLDIAHRYGEKLKSQIVSVFVAGLIWLPIKTALVFYVFTHNLSWTSWLYAWIRDTRVGEITPLGDLAYRIFFQSAVYAVLALPFIAAMWFEKGFFFAKKKWTNILVGLVAILCSLSILIGLSRSFWLGGVIGLLTVCVLGLVKSPVGQNLGSRLKKMFGTLVGIGLSLLVSLLLILTVWQTPWPNAPQGHFWDLFVKRSNLSDSAGSSRWNLLPVMLQKIEAQPILGYGFGATVTYHSLDPRVLLQHPDGMFTTYAFEWGWLGFWIKFGIFGIPIMAWLLASIAWRARKSEYDWWIRTGIVAATIGLAAVHFFTPYLDHPLGFGWILGVEGLLAIKREEESPNL